MVLLASGTRRGGGRPPKQAKAGAEAGDKLLAVGTELQIKDPPGHRLEAANVIEVVPDNSLASAEDLVELGNAVGTARQDLLLSRTSLDGHQATLQGTGSDAGHVVDKLAALDNREFHRTVPADRDHVGPLERKGGRKGPVGMGVHPHHLFAIGLVLPAPAG